MDRSLCLESTLPQHVDHVSTVFVLNRGTNAGTSAGNRNPVKADVGGSDRRGRFDGFTAQACLDLAHNQRNSTPQTRKPVAR